jgi:hypothetical protein
VDRGCMDTDEGPEAIKEESENEGTERSEKAATLVEAEEDLSRPLEVARRRHNPPTGPRRGGVPELSSRGAVPSSLLGLLA